MQILLVVTSEGRQTIAVRKPSLGDTGGFFFAVVDPSAENKRAASWQQVFNKPNVVLLTNAQRLRECRVAQYIARAEVWSEGELWIPYEWSWACRLRQVGLRSAGTSVGDEAADLEIKHGHPLSTSVLTDWFLTRGYREGTGDQERHSQREVQIHGSIERSRELLGNSQALPRGAEILSEVVDIVDTASRKGWAIRAFSTDLALEYPAPAPWTVVGNRHYLTIANAREVAIDWSLGLPAGALDVTRIAITDNVRSLVSFLWSCEHDYYFSCTQGDNENVLGGALLWSQNSGLFLADIDAPCTEVAYYLDDAKSGDAHDAIRRHIRKTAATRLPEGVTDYDVE